MWCGLLGVVKGREQLYVQETWILTTNSNAAEAA